MAMHPEKMALQIANPKAVAEALSGEAKPLPPKMAELPSVAEAPAALAAVEDALPVGLLFPGQGSQSVGMLNEVKDLPAVREMLETAKRVLGYDILKICVEGPDETLQETKYAQPALYIGGLAAIEKLKADKPDCVSRCKAVAGLSLGEYTALTVAGVFSFEAGLRLVKAR